MNERVPVCFVRVFCIFLVIRCLEGLTTRFERVGSANTHQRITFLS
jgi:hypothetical protein